MLNEVNMRKKLMKTLLYIIFSISMLCFILVTIIAFMGDIIGVNIILRFFAQHDIPFSFFTPYIVIPVSLGIAILSNALLKKMKEPSPNIIN